MTRLYLDTECYKDYYLLMVMDDTERTAYVEAFDGQPLDVDKLRKLLSTKAEYVSFNGNNYDMVTLRYALAGANTYQLKQLSDAIITKNLKPWEAERQYELVDLKLNHVDLIEVAPGQASLKLYGARMHCPALQDLPLDPDASVTPELRQMMRRYCKKDLFNTKLLRDSLAQQVTLREHMNAELRDELGEDGRRILRLDDLRSKSDAQIAEAVLKTKVFKVTGAVPRKRDTPPKDFKYHPPLNIGFVSDELKAKLEIIKAATMVVNKETGHVTMPSSIADMEITIGSSTYTLGMGGLHSQESEVSHYADENTYLRDIDVRSYYPNLMLNMKMYPDAMGPHFLKAYRGILDERLVAKDTGDKVKDAVLKITLNGTFGKTSSKYSILYNPSMTIHTTLTGQLSILMLIEELERHGIPVVSANTDGIVVKAPRDKEDLQRKIVRTWERRVALETEETDYSSIHSRDVNSYIAIKTDGKVKTKGFFAKAGLAKNPQNEVCVDAVVAYLTHGVPLRDSIESCKELGQFLTVRRVTGGAAKDGAYLGKVVRWYYAKGATGVIRYASNQKIVGRTSKGKPCMDLPEQFPTDIDYDWYVTEAEDLLADIGVGERRKKAPLPRRGTHEWKRLAELGLVGVDDYGKPQWEVHFDEIPVNYAALAK